MSNRTPATAAPLEATQTAPQAAPGLAPVQPLPRADTIDGVFGTPRLDPYRSFFRCASHEETLGAYLWGQAIAGPFQPLLGLYEVVLRNSIHRASSAFSSKKSSNSHPWYDYHRHDALPVKGKSRVKVEELLYSGLPGQRVIRKPRASTNRAAGLPVTGGEFWLNLVTHKQQSAVEIASAAIAQLGLTGRNKAQIQKLKQRVVPGLNGLLSADKIKDSGKGRDRRFFRD